MKKKVIVVGGWLVSIIVAIIGTYGAATIHYKNENKSANTNVNTNSNINQIVLTIDGEKRTVDVDEAQSILDEQVKQNNTLRDEISAIEAKIKADEAAKKDGNMLKLVPAYDSRYYDAFSESNFLTMGGEQYFDSFKLRYDGYALFNLNEEYTKISGKIGRIDNSSMDNTTVTFFLDGNLVKTIEVIAQDLPKDFVLDIAGASQLKIVKSNSGAEIGFGYLKII